jgi:hypothetical protein
MSCEDYKDALIEAAASGAATQGDLLLHLDGCASCRAAFDEEQFLFAAIDSELHVKANADVPSSLLVRVRAQLDEVVMPRFRWLQPLVFASAGVALTFVVFLMAWPHHVKPEAIAKQSPIVAPTPTAPATRSNPEGTSPEGIQVASIPVRHVHAARNSTGVHSAASGNVEVLVPPDEREGLAQLVATLSEQRDVAAALLALHPEKKDALVTVDPLKISKIEIKPLEGTETGPSDGTGEKH